MRHPAEGVLRRLLDEPAAVAEADRAHVEGCATCQRQLAAVGDDATFAAAALATDPVADEQVDAAWRRLATATATTTITVTSGAPVAPLGTVRPPTRRRPRRFRQALRRPAVAGVAAAAILVGAGTAAATGWLPIFQTEQVAPISLTADDLAALPDLGDYGEAEVTTAPDAHPVPDDAAAAAETGLDVPEVAALPRGVDGEPSYQVLGQAEVTFTFSADRAARAAGDGSADAPAGLDGTSVQLVAGPGVAATWSGSTGVPDLIVARAVAPTALSTSGVPFDVLRDHLLSLPGLPDELASSLRAVGPDGATLPLPIPAEHVTTSTAEVHGRPATVLTSRDGLLAAVVWVDGGIATVVAGPLDADEVLDVARGLR